MSQKEQILDYLLDGNDITHLDALDLFGSFRLAAVIFKLRKEGYPIVTDTEISDKGEKEYACYYIHFNDLELARLRRERQRQSPCSLRSASTQSGANHTFGDNTHLGEHGCLGGTRIEYNAR